MKTATPRSHGLGWLPFTAALFLFGAVTISAQVVPATPKKFTKRDLGGGSASIGPSIAPAAPQPSIVRTTTYFALSDSRQWTSSDGKPLLAKLVAFEDIVIETQGNQSQAATPAPPPAMPTNPTVVRDGKVRLLSGKAPYEVPLDRLSQPDRDFIEGIRTAVAQKAAATAAAPVASEKK
ncbi:MAG: hypothetical protein ACAH88_09370 [Roseimicrobium sp.]